MEQYPVVIECNKTQYRKIKNLLWFYDIRWDKTSVASGVVTQKEYKKLFNKCKKHNIKIYIDSKFTRRSTDYRRNFYRNNPPHIGMYYFCAYCGSLIKINKVTVDHLYPVAAIKENIKLQEKLKRKGYKSANDIKNLIPSCRNCNSRKGKHTGIWIIKGRIGRHPALWVFRHFIRIGFFVAFLYLLIKYSTNYSDLYIVKEFIHGICYKFTGR